MASSPDLRQQLQSLSIPRDRRPAGAARRVSGRGWLFKLILLGLLAGIVWWGYTNREMLLAQASSLKQSVSDATNPPVEVATMTVRAQTEQSTPPVLTATGKIVSDHRVEVQTKVSGQIVDLTFEQGDHVQQGQVLARIEDVNYKARRDEAAAMVEKAKAAIEFCDFEYNRVSGMAKDMKSDRELVSAKRGLDEAKAQLAADEAALAWAEKAYRDTQVIAPISGVILERNVEVGDFVAAEGGRGANANAQFAAIADMTKLRVEIDVSELDVARIKAGMPCTVVPDAYKDRKYRGQVMWIDPGANYAKATVQAKVRIEEPDEFLRVEGSAKVQFLTPEPEKSRDALIPTLWIPASAIRRDGTPAAPGQPAVFVVVDHKLKATPVRLGREISGQVEVLEGLSDGQTIASGEVEKLTDGQRVK